MAPGSGSAILVVDDRRAERLPMEEMLRQAGYTVLSAASGRGALKKLSHCPDLILIDYQMPQMDGLLLLQKIRRRPDYEHVPIIMLLAVPDLEVRHAAFVAGADNYLIKPCHEGTLLTVVMRLLEREGLRAGLENTLRERNAALTERVKELNCLYAISRIIQRPEVTLEEILQEAVKIIPASWQYPEHTRCRIELFNRQYASSDFRASRWRQTAEIILEGEKWGQVEVFYARRMPPAFDGPFLKEEQKLLLAVAERLGRAAERIIAREERRHDLLRVETLLQLNKMTAVPIEEVADFTLEGIVRDTDSEFGFLGFLSADETSMDIHAWSTGAMSRCSVQEQPLHFPLAQAGVWAEAIRHRRPCIIEDYNQNHPAKRGIPKGHAPIYNFLGVPAFDGDRIVAVAGLANRRSGYRDIDAKHAVVLLEDLCKLLQRRKAETELRESEAHYRTLFENTVNPILLINTAGDYIDANQAGLDFLETSRKELVTKNIRDFLVPGEETDLEQHRPLWQTGGIIETEYFVNGRVKTLMLTITPAIRHGEPLLYGIGSDITEQKQIEQQQALLNNILKILNRPGEGKNIIREILLRIKAELQLEAVGIRLREGEDYPYYETNGFSNDFVTKENFLCARDGQGEPLRDETGNPCLECMCGLVLSGRADPAKDFFTVSGSFWTNSTTQLLASTTEADRGGGMRGRCHSQGYESMALIPLKSGENIIGLLQCNDIRPDRFSSDRITFLEKLGASIGIALGRIQAEELFVHTARQWEITFDAMSDPVVLLDNDQQIVRANRAMAETFGKSFDELIGSKCYMSVEELPAPPENCPHTRVLADGRPHTRERYLPHLDKTFLVNVSPIYENRILTGAVHVMRDITLEKRTEEELKKTHKLESLGILAGGLAHDFNNILSVLWGNIQMADMNAEQPERIREFLAEAESSCLRARDLVKQLSIFAKGEAPITEATRLTEVIKEVARFVLRGSNVKPEFLIPDNLPPAEADRSQISRVVENLVRNADQAMPEGGVLKIAAETVHCDAGDAAGEAGLAPGDYLRIRITDQGVGIVPEHLPCIFDPYWTTRSHGSGLGLTICYSIMKKHNGHIRVRSAPEKGTIVDLYLPLAQHPEEEQPAQTDLEAGHGRILVMDDNPGVREVVGAMLENLDYEPDFAAGGEEALEKYRHALQAARPYAAVILDLTVPGGMGGVETMQELIKTDPTVKALVSSGYFDESVMAEHRQYGFSGVVPKPVDIKILSRELKRILE